MFSNKAMSSKSATDQSLPSLAKWKLSDLRDLYMMLGGLIEALENPLEKRERETDGGGRRVNLSRCR